MTATAEKLDMSQYREEYHGSDGVKSALSLESEHEEQVVRDDERDVIVTEKRLISPLGVLGVLLVVALIFSTLMQYAALVEINDQVVSMSNELSSLQEEGNKLTTRYELAYDLQAIEQEMLLSGEMVKAQSSQMYMVTISQPDGVLYYTENSVLDDIVDKLNEIMLQIAAYF